MKKDITVLFIFLFSIAFCSAQNTFLKVLGKSIDDVYYDLDETTDSGILFSGNLSGNFCFTRCDSNADTIWSKFPPSIPGVSFNDMCTLEDGRYALAGSKHDPSGGEAAVVIIDSACGFNSSQYFLSDGWSMSGRKVYAMPDSGVMFTAYDDGYTCSNTLQLFHLDRTLNQVSSSGIGLCDAGVSYTEGFGKISQLMHFLKIHYYEIDSNGNWMEDVPHVISVDVNGIKVLDSWYFINKTFTGISDASDSGAVVYGITDTLGSKQIHLMKISKTGVISWVNSFGTLYDDYPVSVIETDDHGFAILSTQNMTGSTTGIDMVFYKLDSLGQLQFSQVYGSTGNETAIKMIKKKDGSLLILGRTNGFGAKVNMIIQLDNSGNLNPAYAIDASATHLCTGQTATLTVSQPAAQYMWSTGETTSSINVTSSGNYEVMVVDLSGNTHHVPFQAIYFDSFPDATMLNALTVSFCDGQDASLSVTHAHGNVYQWYNNGILINTAYNYIYNASQSGIYKTVVSNICGTDTSTEVIVTNHPNPPEPQVSAFPSTHECSTTPVTLAASSSGNILNWVWSGNNFTGDTLILSQPNRYYLSVSATNSFGCESPSQTIQIVIDGPPQVAFTQSVMNICVPGSTLIPYTYSSNYGLYSYYRNDTLVGTYTSPSNFTATYSTKLSIVMSNSCGSDTTSIDVNAVPKPVVEIFPSSPVLCSGSPVLVSCLTPGTYRWFTNWNPSQTFITTSSFLISGIDNYILEVTDAVTGCKSQKSFTPAASSEISPIINLIPDAVVCPGNSINLDAGNFSSYLWSTGDLNSNITLTNSGTIDTMNVTVTVVDALNCSAVDTVSVIFDICASVREDKLFEGLKVYPNPSSSKILFEIPQQYFNEKATLYIFSLEGKLMTEKNFSQSTLELNVLDFPPSMYSYLIQSEERSVRGVVEVVN